MGRGSRLANATQIASARESVLRRPGLPSGIDSPAAQAAYLMRDAVEVLPADGLEAKLAEAQREGRPLRIKLGMDPTAPDVHLGHGVVLAKLREFQQLGHEVVLIVGDYTSRIGDPSGRSDTRPQLDDEQIDANARTYAEQVFRVLDPQRTELRRNSEWLEMGVIELFGLARKATVAQLLERDDFAKRFANHQPISVLELLYPLVQGYDSVAVRADVELGGTDQKFNLLLAREIQRAYGQSPQVTMAMPILTGLDGQRKMSKSLGNYIGLTEDPQQAFGKAMSIPDELMDSWDGLLFESQLPADLPPVARKRLLARSLAEQVGGPGAGARAEVAFDRVHKRRQAPEQMPQLGLPSEGVAHVPGLLAEAFDISRGEARRQLKQNAVRLDGEVVSELDLPVSQLSGRVLQWGKRRFVRLG